MSWFQELLNGIATALSGINSTNMFISLVGNDIVKASELYKTIEWFADIYKPMSVAGMCLVSVFFLINWIEAMTYNEANMEKFVSLLLKLALCVFFIKEGFNLLSYIVEFGDQLVVSYMASVEDITTQTTEVMIQDLDILGVIANLLTLLPVRLVVLVVNLCSKFIVYTRFFEVNLHLLAAPIAFANMFEEK